MIVYIREREKEKKKKKASRIEIQNYIPDLILLTTKLELSSTIVFMGTMGVFALFFDLLRLK